HWMHWIITSRLQLLGSMLSRSRVRAMTCFPILSGNYSCWLLLPNVGRGTARSCWLVPQKSACLTGSSPSGRSEERRVGKESWSGWAPYGLNVIVSGYVRHYGRRLRSAHNRKTLVDQ